MKIRPQIRLSSGYSGFLAPRLAILQAPKEVDQCNLPTAETGNNYFEMIQLFNKKEFFLITIWIHLN